MQLTTFHHPKTTNSPQKTIHKNVLFLKTPCKNASPPPQKNMPEKSTIHPGTMTE
ncbi:MAG: hypothetical protein WDN23_20950 [Edaphobacter sp.]